jgi:hypothetical protein
MSRYEILSDICPTVEEYKIYYAQALYKVCGVQHTVSCKYDTNCKIAPPDNTSLS